MIGILKTLLSICKEVAMLVLIGIGYLLAAVGCLVAVSIFALLIGGVLSLTALPLLLLLKLLF